MNLRGNFMGAIGGIIDFKSTNIDFLRFNAIRNAQTLRGRKSSVAYCNNGAAMLYNSDGVVECDQPIISERKGYTTTFIIDSSFFDARQIVEGYHAYGVEFVGMLDFPFAIALYDEKRKVLLLARDKNGRKPLYYGMKAGKVFFSSEPKGILATEDKKIRVNSEILSAHLTSQIGIYSAADIYSDIFEVRCGECVLFSELGVSRFFYRENNSKKISAKSASKTKVNVIEPDFTFDRSVVFSALDDALVAFDIPQFDAYMPSVCRLFSNAKDYSAFHFADYIKRYNIQYSYEREDRLRAFYGKFGTGVMVRLDDDLSEKQWADKKCMLEALTEAFFLLERNEILFLRNVFGDIKLNYIINSIANERIKKENTDEYIRILGMIYQAAKWSKLRELELVNDRR